MRKMCKKLFLFLLTMILVFSMGIVSNAASIKISKKKATLYVTQTTELKVNGTSKKAKWSSSNKKIAKVSSNGKVTAVKAGKATITAKIGKKSYKCQVTVKNGLNQEKVTLEVGKKTTVKILGSKIKSVKTNKKSVATISKNGKITAKKPGKCKITINGKDGKKYTCTVTVIQKVNNIVLNKAETSLYTGSSEQLTATVAPDNAADKKVTWSSSNNGVVTVDTTGKITALKAGKAVITAAAADGSGKTASCAVTVMQLASGVKLSQTSAELTTGTTFALTVTVSPTDTTNAAVKWSSSNPAVATVSGNGTVTAIKAGKTDITVTTSDGSAKTASCTVTVIQKAASISVAPKSVTVVEGNTVALNATVLPVDTTNAAVTWSSSNTAVATVAADGTVTAVAPGKTQIKAVTSDGTNLAAVCEVTVEDDGIEVVATQSELSAALDMNVHTVIVQTNSAVSLSIPDGTHTEKKLVVNAPNSEVTNAARWKEIELQAIAENTFIEKANGNNILYKAMNGRIEIAGGASAGINISGNTAGQKLNLENYGTISDMVLNNRANVQITGRETSAAVPITSTPNAAGSSINTSQNLRLHAESPINLILQAGAENSTAVVNNDANRPDVSGLGSVTVTNTETNEVDTIVAETTGSVVSKTVEVTGLVDVAEDNTPISGVSVYLIPYSASIDTDRIETYYQAENVKKVQTAEDGSYRFSDVELGNYYLAATVSDYATNVQTLVITSITGDTYTNTVILMIKADNSTPGKIEGTLTDAFTGEAIDYPVVLKVRCGQNNLSGSAVRTVNITASDMGSYSVEDLEPGVYTLQALSASGSDVKIMLTSFNVTVLPGETVTGNYTVTRQLEESQVRFVLTWGTESSGAPRDLDSHLTGPSANGTGRFHTYYNDTEYFYNDVKYADLDVDDTTWEGPETTTIYVNTDGSYSFYVFDFTDQEDEYSTRMSNDSNAIVNVYKGETMIGTFYVPGGQSGNLWHVCDYNADTGILTGVNTIGYWPNEGSSSVGLSAAEVYRQKLNARIFDLENMAERLSDGEYKNGLEAAIASAKSVADSSADEAALGNALASLEAYVQVMYEMPYIDSIYGDNVMNYSVNGNRITVYGTADVMGDITAETYSESETDVAYTTVYQAVSGEEYVGMITATRTDIGLSVIWYVYYTFDMSVFAPTDVTGEGIVDFKCRTVGTDGLLRVYGTALTMPELTLSVKDKIEYRFAVDPNGTYDAVIYMLYDNSREYVFYVDYVMDSSVFAINSVTGEGITDYEIDRYSDDGELYLYGIADTLPDFTLSVNENVHWEYDADARIIHMTYGGHSYTYYVYYYFDSSVFDINSVTGEGITEYIVDRYSDEGELYLHGIADTLPDFTLSVNENVHWEYDADARIIHMTYGGHSYKYYVYYGFDSSIFTINGVSGEGIVDYDSDRDSDVGELNIYGMSDTLPDFTLSVNENVNWRYDADTGIIYMTYGNYSYKYNVSYRWNYRVFDITDVTGDGIFAYDYVNNPEGNNALVLHGSSDTADVSSITVETGYQMTIDVEAEADDTTDVIGYVHMKLDDMHSATYAVYYKKADVLTLDERVSVEVTSEMPTKNFLFIPEEDGSYLFQSFGEYDSYCTLYDSNGNKLTYDDDNDYEDENVNFYLEYELYAGQTYRFEVREYDRDNASFEVLLKLCDYTYEIDPIEELEVSEELSVDLTTGEMTGFEAAPESESELTESESEDKVSENVSDSTVIPDDTEEVLLVDEFTEILPENSETVLANEMLEEVPELTDAGEFAEEDVEPEIIE